MSETITLPLADVRALVKLAMEQTRYIEATDKSATASIYGIEYADKTVAKVAVRLPVESKPLALAEPGSATGAYLAEYYERKDRRGESTGD